MKPLGKGENTLPLMNADFRDPIGVLLLSDSRLLNIKSDNEATEKSV
jgi:hypothetical protein